MSSEFSCDYCSNSPRNPCYSEEEAAVCPNCDNAAAYLSFDAAKVAVWIRYHNRHNNGAEYTRLEEAAKAVEEYLRWK